MANQQSQVIPLLGCNASSRCIKHRLPVHFMQPHTHLIPVTE